MQIFHVKNKHYGRCLNATYFLPFKFELKKAVPGSYHAAWRHILIHRTYSWWTWKPIRYINGFKKKCKRQLNPKYNYWSYYWGPFGFTYMRQKFEGSN